MSRKGKLPAQKGGDVVYRTAKASVVDVDAIPLVLATETPVRVWDYSERSIMGEVLRMDGLEVPQQIPLLDSHNRSEVRNVIGSIRDLRIVGDKLEGKAFFASNEHAQEVRDLYIEGHATDFSIGFEPGQIQRVRDGESKTINGRTYSGPTRVVTSAKVKEGSAVAIGADENSKALHMPALRAYTQPDQLKEESDMSFLRDLCLAEGMPADQEDHEQWAKDNLRAHKEEPKREPAVSPEPLVGDDRENERQRAAKITHYCSLHGVSPQQAASYIASSLSSEEVATDILVKLGRKRMGEKIGPVIEPVESEAEKFADGARGALIQRCLMGVNVDRAEQHARGEYEHMGRTVQTHFRDHAALSGVSEVKRLIDSPTADSFRNVGLYDMARMFVEYSGERTWGLSRNEVVRRAFALDYTRRDSSAYHTTGSFTNVLLDAAKKTLLMAYEEAAVTYPMWVRQAPSTTDFKTINRIRLGEIPNPEIVPENGKYGEVAVTDGKETYHVEKYGHIFSISLEAIVNDDLNAISRIPAQQGYAMRRKINALCYAQLTGNPTMGDGVALFHSTSHGANLDATALSVAALNVGWTVMSTQVGLTSGVVLNIQPRYLLVPPALSYTALQIAGSMADPSSTKATTEDADRPGFNSGVLNVYGPNGSRPLTPIVDAAISTSQSATAWYLAAEPTQIDTVELCFLQGEETPYLERENSFEVDSVRYKIRQTFGAKPIDYRGLYQGNA
jgi:hypothetical protein